RTGRTAGGAAGGPVGGADAVAETDARFARAVERDGEVAQGPVLAHGLAKRALDRGLDITLGGGLDLEQQLFVEVFRTDDAQAGVASFLEQGPGKAKFRGR